MKDSQKIISISKLLPSYTTSGLILSVIYVMIFVTLFFYLNNTPITLSKIIEMHQKDPILIVVEILPLLVYFAMRELIMDISNKVVDVENELARLNAKNRAIYNFVEQLRQGRTDITFDHEFLQDRLIQSLIKLRDELQRSREEEEQRKKEEEHRHWINEGLAKFSAILRENLDNLTGLAEEITSNLTRYLDAKQAAFFVIEEEKGEKYLNMIAFFAYDRKKFPDKKLMWGEGLIGAAVIEKNIVVLNDTTEDFVEITSGLGGANPRAIIIAPLVDSEDNVHGAIEMASFKPFEDYQVTFIEQIAQSIADTIANIKRNLRTQELLRESQKQAEILAQQEEKMRRNMEELKMLQLEAAKQSEEFVSFTNSVNKALIRAEFTREGFLVYANENFLKLLGYNDYFEVINKHVTNFLSDSDRDVFDTLWNSFVEEGRVYDADIRFVTRNMEIKWVSSAFIGIKNKQGETIKILFLGLDRTEEKLLQQEYLALVKFMNNVILRMEFTPEGNLVDINNNFLNLLDLTRDDVIGKNYIDILNFQEFEDFDVIWRNILAGATHNVVHRLKNQYGNDIWIEAYYFAFIEANKPLKVYLIAFDITQQKLLEQKIQDLKEQLELKDKILSDTIKDYEGKIMEVENKAKSVERSVKLLEGLFENFDSGVVIIDESGHIVYFNAEAEKLWNMKREVIIGKRLASILPEVADEYNDDVDYLLKYFNTENPLLNKRRISYIIDREGNRVNVQVFIVKSEYEDHSYIAAFIRSLKA